MLANINAPRIKVIQQVPLKYYFPLESYMYTHKATFVAQFSLALKNATRIDVNLNCTCLH